MRFDRIHHVAVIVSDYRRSREFYVEKLGLPVLRENYRKDRGDWKLDIHAAVEELEARGIECEPIRWDPYTQKPMTFFRDPDGLPLELHE